MQADGGCVLRRRRDPRRSKSHENNLPIHSPAQENNVEARSRAVGVSAITKDQITKSSIVRYPFWPASPQWAYFAARLGTPVPGMRVVAFYPLSGSPHAFVRAWTGEPSLGSAGDMPLTVPLQWSRRPCSLEKSRGQ